MFSSQFSENDKVQTMFTKSDIPTSHYQNEALILPKKIENKSLVSVLPRKAKKALVQNEKLT